MILIYFLMLFSNYEDSIHNPENEEYVVEVAFNLDISPEQVTQKQFNNRYK